MSSRTLVLQGASPFWRWQLAGWLAYGIAMYLAAVQALGPELALVNKSVNVAIGFTLSLGLRAIYRWLHARSAPMPRILLALLAGSLVAGAAWSALANSFFWWFVRGDLAGLGTAQLFAWTLVHAIVFVAWCAVYVGATTVEQLRRTRVLAQVAHDAPAQPPLVVRTDGELLRLPQEQIHCIEAARNYSCIVSDAGTHVVRTPLSKLGEQLDARAFVRVHRSAIVAVGRLRSLRSLPTQDAIATLAGGREIRVSRGYRAQLERAMNGGL